MHCPVVDIKYPWTIQLQIHNVCIGTHCVGRGLHRKTVAPVGQQHIVERSHLLVDDPRHWMCFHNYSLMLFQMIPKDKTEILSCLMYLVIIFKQL